MVQVFFRYPRISQVPRRDLDELNDLITQMKSWTMPNSEGRNVVEKALIILSYHEMHEWKQGHPPEIRWKQPE